MKQTTSTILILIFIVISSAIAATKAPTDNSPTLTLNLAQNKTAASVLTLTNPQLGIPEIYTAKAATTGQLNNAYFQQYANAWSNFLANVQITAYADPKQAYQAIQVLSSNDSPLLQLLQLFNHNAINPVIEQNSELAALQQAINSPNLPYSTTKVQTLLQQLNTYLASLNSNAPQASAFALTKSRFENQGKNDPITELFSLAQISPAPLNHWLYQIAQNTWRMLLLNTQTYINSQWQQQVVPQYNAQIAGLYPFNNMSGNQVSLESFSNFFAPNGIFDKFTAQYLDAFVDSSQQPWELKSLNGLGLTLSDTTLQAFQQMQTIENIYFPNGDQHLRVPFSIEAFALTKQLKQVNISLGGQTASFTPEQSGAAYHFLWPDNENSNQAAVTLINAAGKPDSFSETGPWAWLKILADANLQTAKQEKTWVATFGDKDTTARLAIYTEQNDNPFSLERFSEFQFPRSLE